jgi:nucleoside-diphosphate-sugar epimerase
MEYFVTGGTGFIGGRVIKRLLQAGHKVVALVRSARKAAFLKDSGVLLAEGDITDKSSLMPAMSGVDGVFHIAGWYRVGVDSKSLAEKINVEGTRNVLEAMKELGIKKGVYTSTLAVNSDTKGQIIDESYTYNGSHLSVYDHTKWKAQYEVAEPMMKQGLPLVIVLPGLVYGPGDTSQIGEAFRKILLRKLPMIVKKNAYCWAHVDDVAQGHILAMEKGKPGDSYIIAGPPHTLEEAVAIGVKITGQKGPLFRVSPGVAKFLSLKMKILGFAFHLPPEFTAESLRVSAGVTYLGSNEKAKKELGYSVRPLEEGLKETLLDIVACSDVV